MQALFQLDAQGDGFGKQVGAFLRHGDTAPVVVEYADQLVAYAWSHRNTIDAMIVEVSAHWSIDRMTPVDRSILRMAVGEMMLDNGPPHAVVINEAIELGKQFGESESPQFVNGVLDAVRKRLSADDAESADESGSAGDSESGDATQSGDSTVSGGDSESAGGD